MKRISHKKHKRISPVLPDPFVPFVANSFRVICLILVFCFPASAQWVNIPLPNTPRTADGKPNLSAPAPKTRDGKPDLSGIWRVADGRYLQNIAVDMGEAPFQPWAAALYKERADNLGKGRPSERCIPHGIPDGMLVRNSPFKIVRSEERRVGKERNCESE